MSDAVLTTCPACGKETYKKQVTAAGFQLKGSGWYATDFKGGGKKPAAKDATKTESKTESKSDTKTEAKSDAKTDSKAGTKATASADGGS